MFNSVAINVVIGLVFIYLLYSLLATTINEAIASLLNLRAQKLEKAITRMLNDGIMHHDNIWSFLGDSIKRILNQFKSFFLFFSFRKRSSVKDKMSLVEVFYNNSAMKYLGENKISNKPSYISPEFFSKALMDILKEKSGKPNETVIRQIQVGIESLNDANETKAFIQSLLIDANNDLDEFRTALEQWFNETMNRTSGWYKRQSQKMTFVIGFVLAISFNVDTISIVKKLSNDPNAAKALAEVASKYVETHKDSTGHLTKYEKDTAEVLFASAKKQVDMDISNANSIIGLGWNIPSDTNQLFFTKNAMNTKLDTANCKKCLDEIKNASLFGNTLYRNEKSAQINSIGKVRYVWCMAFTSRRFLGYLITALAISLGAPFWFDLLNKFVQLRGAGKKPDEAAQTNKDSEISSVKRVG